MSIGVTPRLLVGSVISPLGECESLCSIGDDVFSGLRLQMTATIRWEYMLSRLVVPCWLSHTASTGSKRQERVSHSA